MAERKVVAAVRSPDSAGEALEELNDQLGRFLRQADALLDEWTRFGADVRTRVGGEVDRIGDAVASATDAAVSGVAAKTSAALVARLDDVNAEIERVTRAARRASAAAAELRTERSRGLTVAWIALGAAVVSNVLLVIVIALLMRDPSVPTPAITPVRAEPPLASEPVAAPAVDAGVPDAAVIEISPDAAPPKKAGRGK
jgi:hypothetical protein